MPRLLVASSFAFAITACTFALAQDTGTQDTGKRDSVPEPEPPSSLAAASERFAFHSHAWLGLHHFLYQWARTETERSPRDTRPVPRVAEKSALGELTGAERTEWEAAWQYYRERAVPMSLTFDAGMRDIKARVLAIDPDAKRPTDAELEALGELGMVLTAAMPIYRKHFWEAHDETNRIWIQEQAKSLERFEPTLIAGLLTAYGGEWPEHEIRVDVSVYTNWAGAYTTNFPNHIMVSSTDAEMSGWLGLETIVHEVSHTTPLEGGHIEATGAAFEAIGAEAPERLWHAILFYTAGELTHDVLADAGVDDFVPYAEKLGFYERPSWAGYRAAFDEHWRPMLAAETTREEAYAGIARALTGK